MATESTESNPSAINLLSDSRDIYTSVLSLFKQNHDLCTRSGFISSNVILEIDSCAIDFRSLGLQTATVAKLVSSLWLGSIIQFYENISVLSHSEAVKLLQKYGVQAKKLSLIFKVIAAWARDLSGRIHTACTDLENEIEAFKIKFAQALQDSMILLDQAEVDLQAKQKNLQEKIAEKNRWETGRKASILLFFISLPAGLVGTLVSNAGLAVARKAVHDARGAELEAEKHLDDAIRAFESAKNNDEKAKMIAEVAAALLTSLRGMEIISQAISRFWTDESALFEARASDILANQIDYNPIVLAHAVSAEEITAWREAEQMFDQYAAVMATIMNIYNYNNNATAASSTSYHVAELAYTLKIPSTVDVEGIMEGHQET